MCLAPGAKATCHARHPHGTLTRGHGGAGVGTEREQGSLEVRYPHMSARQVFTRMQAAAALSLALALWGATQAAPALLGATLHMVALIGFGAIIVMRLFAGATSMAGPPRSRARWTEPLPRYSILCPLRSEARAAPALLAALAALDYPAHLRDVKLIVDADDGETLSALLKLNLPQGFEIVIAPTDGPRTKPRALNHALARADGAFVAVYDAEDAPHPEQLRAALDAFAEDARLGAVQAPLLIDNAGASWIAAQFAAEYAIQFRGMLPLLARMNAPLPLGGASNHFRRSALEDAAGWDAWNVTEDADLAYRLARRGWRLGVIAPPTWEEAPARFRPWLRQRTRWIKGHLQTWLVLNRNPVATMRDMGLSGYFWMQLVLGGGLAAAFAHAPLLLWLLTAAIAPSLAKIAPWDWVLVISGYAVSALAAIFAGALQGSRRLMWSALTMPLYWPLSTLAAVCALLEIVLRPHYWAKTDHGLTAREPHPA
jgi:glycosyltransferase XagB